MTDKDAVTKVIASFYQDDLCLVFLIIYVPILYLPTFSGFSPCHDQGSRNAPATSTDSQPLSEDFWTLPKMSANVPKTFEHSYFKDDNFSVL